MNSSLADGADANVRARVGAADMKHKIDTADSEETEFWDACWTLEEEWHQSATSM